MQYRSIKTIILTVSVLAFSVPAQAQVYLKSEYIIPSKFKDEDKQNLGGKGGLSSIDGGLRIPVSIKMNENNRPTAWAVALGGTYASMHTKNLSEEYYLSEILNAQLGIMHLRLLNDKWSMLAVVGAGIFTSELSKISGNSILGQGGILFIRHAKPNFDWGFGVSLNNALGYPMIFPSFYLNWELDGKYEFKLSMYNSFEIGVNTRINDYFKLGIVGESKGLMSAVKVNGRSMYFVTQYGYAGVQPEFRIEKSLSIPVTCGVSFSRDTYFQSKSLKAFYVSKDDYPHFGVSGYFAVGIKYGF
ncbi:DUF6268 family outer membrane beta-barrel protein [Porphyromonas macacae]|uniref:DUF6268 family outer membrane beta-barrel protein n=1 Tax=Porphyromonas macacae TaxID=28115 RepID=UPI0024AE58B5|nr:DUF6268 family outer membrane beta-barrel protein [Porphyromonas macacae]